MPAQRPPLIRLLGAPRVELAGVPVAFDTRKALAVVAVIALDGRQARDRLAALLWPDSSSERARGALRRTLSTLRSALGDHLVTDSLAVSLAGVEVDVERFRSLAAAGTHADAAAAYTGDLLDGFALRECEEFEEWQAERRDALRGELAATLEHLVHTEADQGRAIAHARRWLALDPLHEPAHRGLMRLLARGGDRSAAVRQYRDCVRILDHELGVAPLPETTALAATIERGVPEGEPAQPAAVGVDEAVGDLYTRHGDYARAISSLETALAAAREHDRARVAHKLADVHHRRGDWQRAEDHYRAALRGESDLARRARITADWSLAAHRRGDAERARRLADEALAAAERAGDERALAQAHNLLGMLLHDRGHLERSLALAERIGDPDARVAALNNLALTVARDGDVARATELTRVALTVAAERGDRHREAALHNNLADLLHRSGDRDGAMRALRRAVTLFAEIGGGAGHEPEVWKLVRW